MSKSYWNAEDEATLLRMLNAGATYDEMAKALGRSWSGINNKLRVVKHGARDDSRKSKLLEKKVADLSASLSRARAPRQKFKLNAGKAHKGDYCRFIIPDTHGSKADMGAIGAMLADLEALKPREIVMLGDHLDCGGFLAQHHTMGYVAETSYTFEEDVAACNALLDELAKRAPQATVHYLLGNHEARLEAWVVSMTLRNPNDSKFLRDQFSIEECLHLTERGIRYYERSVFYDGLPIPGTIKLGKCHFTHGTRTGTHAASMVLGDFGGNIVFGHTHRADSFTKRTVNAGVIGAWNPGCMCQLQPLWQHTQITGWSHGYGLQLVRENGDFLHINVPIIDGKSFLVPLTKQVS